MQDKPLADICFEVSFEAGNKVGGIYTVLVSKAKFMKKYYNDNYYAIGFHNPQKAINDFEEREPPNDVKEIFNGLEKEGIKCYWGKWIAAEDVNLILVDSRQFMNKKIGEIRNIDIIKKNLWETHKIDSLRAGFDYDEPLAWSIATGMLIEQLVKRANKFQNKKVVVQLHEWLSGGTLIYLLDNKVPVGLIFTTHATRIGRAKSSAGENLIEEVENNIKLKKTMDDEEAYKFCLEAQHMIEKICANKADVFTTVSEIVAKEARYVLDKSPDIITINGLDLHKYPSTRTLAILHEKYRTKINNFLKAYFSPYYPISVKDNIVFFISGRYEFYNKGVDIFIEALSLLNERMKKQKIKKTVFAFILIPSNVKNPNNNLLESLLRYEKITELIDDELISIKQEIADELISGKHVSLDDIVDEDFKVKAKILSKFFKRMKGERAPLSAFELSYDNDMILNHLEKHNLLNKEDDKVKVIFYPAYLSVTDGLLSMDYNDFVIGSSMGLFPSRYEPWGYTPFETAALRVLSLTTDVSGFGFHLMELCKDKKYIRPRVLKMRKRKREDIIKEVADVMEWCVKLGKEKRPLEKVITRDIIKVFDWKYQIINYINSHNLALDRMKKRIRLS